MQGQGEQIAHANATAELTEYNLAVSRRMVRGMTWSGWVANMVSSEPAPPPPPPSELSTGSWAATVGAAETPQQPTAAEQPREHGWNSTDPSVRAQLQAQDDYLDLQLKNMEQMATVGSLLGESVAKQNSQLGALDGAMDHLNDETRAVIRMQGRLHSSVRGKPKFLYFVAIEHADSGRFLQVSSTPQPDTNHCTES